VRSCSPRSCSPSPAVGEKIFSRNLYLSIGSSREVFPVEVVLRAVVLLEVVLRETVLRKPWHSKERFLTARAPNPQGATPTFSTRIENQDHSRRASRLMTNDHNQRIIMNTLANVGVTNNNLWWALNCVSLLFASSKCGTTDNVNGAREPIYRHDSVTYGNST